MQIDDLTPNTLGDEQTKGEVIARIDALSFGNDVIELPPHGVTLIVGPNNSGKSVLLRDIAAISRNEVREPEFQDWPSSAKLRKTADEELLREFMKPWINPPNAAPGQEDTYAQPSRPGNVHRFRDFLQRWTENPGFQDISSLVAVYLDAANRLAGNLRLNEPRDALAPPSTPMDRLWDSKQLETKVAAIFERAFGFKVCINRHNPQALALLIGSPDESRESLPASREFLEKLSKLPTVESQGDGVKSFAAIVMHAIVHAPPIILIDEPEAFLHPPQAKFLGRLLAQEATNSQILVATHSTDIIHGILGSPSPREVKIIRLDAKRSYSVLPNADVADLWKDSLLRYSRMLDGLVHQGVIICEGDSDCRFYSAILDARVSGEHDVHFTHVGGKGRLPEAADKLHRLSLRPAVITDIDFLNDDGLVKRLVSAVEGDFTKIESDLKVIGNEVAQRASFPTARKLKEAIRDLKDKPDNSRIDEHSVEQIQNAIKRDSGWDQIKRGGSKAFEPGALVAFERVRDYLKSIGIFVVPVGVLERWEPTVGGRKADFVSQVLDKNFHHSPSSSAPTTELNQFMVDISHYLGLRTS